MDRIRKKIRDARNKFAAPGLEHIDSEISRASLPSQRWFNEKLRRMSLGEKLNLLIKLRDRRQATDADPEEKARLDAFYTLVDRVRDFSTAELLAKDKAGLLKTARAN
jgi:predicted metal-dependent hydrolase